jgi:hypothetical protein
MAHRRRPAGDKTVRRAANGDPIEVQVVTVRETTPRRERAPCLAASNGWRALPDCIEALLGAYAGSVCGRRLSGKPFSTIGFERRHNAAFKLDAENTFVEFTFRGLLVGPPPPAPIVLDRASRLAVTRPFQERRQLFWRRRCEQFGG